MATDLITLNEYLQASGQKLADLELSEQDQITWQITAASQTVRSFTDRDFTLSVDANQAPRQFRYYGAGTLDIDDASAITQVETVPIPSFSGSRVLDVTEWFAMPLETGIYTYIELYSIFLPTGASPEMGFKQNLDNYPAIPYPNMLKVTGTWGWPAIPMPVKQATVLTVQESLRDDAGGYNSEAIAGYSVSRGISRATGNLLVQAVPDQAAALLEPYSRWPV
jgi:hypothetical protein